MTPFRNLGFWGKVLACAWITFLLLTSGESSANWMDISSSGRKRVFSLGFLVLCVFVAVLELILLNHFYGAQMK
ncbi:hypothetical protein [Pseudomonas sp. 13B_3.2_Bac1]|uniref:hypothetical protein n=1 Tax=Pseudomonas sp. 13B_3.2_Bac1 TaxID=2971623 RepID=UPI0021C5BCEA|nr:hypothetical protein [Pseudomonas sp. 13B_3.2_Bac1]MCU1774260.1 hypothetical protein [Pseudomonas sp. 13B_3.2_Bac1]